MEKNEGVKIREWQNAKTRIAQKKVFDYSVPHLICQNGTSKIDHSHRVKNF